MTLTELNQIAAVAKQAEDKAKHLLYCSSQLRSCRVNGIGISQSLGVQRGHFSMSEQAHQALLDTLVDITPDLYRLAEIKLAREARKMETRARVLRAQVEAAIVQEDAAYQPQREAA